MPEQLLFGEIEPDVPKPTTARKVLAIAAGIVTSLFVAYHASILLVWNTPKKGLAKPFHSAYLKKTDGSDYFRAVSSTQSWKMFAPNPNRTNVFMRVLVTDKEGEVWDLKHDIYGVNRYPYMFYDRMGKVNRRINGKRAYQKVYGAWMCRQWEAEHGELPESVQFVKKYTKVPLPPKPPKIFSSKPSLNWPEDGFGYEPWELEVKQKTQETIRCRTETHGQLPPRLRERHGMEPADDKHFREVRTQTWKKKQEAEARKKELEAARAERKKKRQAVHGNSATAPVK